MLLIRRSRVQNNLRINTNCPRGLVSLQLLRASHSIRTSCNKICEYAQNIILLTLSKYNQHFNISLFEFEKFRAKCKVNPKKNFYRTSFTNFIFDQFFQNILCLFHYSSQFFINQILSFLSDFHPHLFEITKIFQCNFTSIF